MLVLLAAPAALRAQRKFDEREIKATFLFNFAQFVEWPAASFADPQAPLVIGVLGDDPFNAVLDAVVRGEMIKNRPLVVTRFRRIEDVATCHILFVSPSETPRYTRISETLQGRAILTVGDTDGFAASGGMIRFITENSHVRLRINLGVARAAGLTISSQLLRVAEVVGQGEVR
ncbi:MAG: YfiR family protein [Vicinamibacterales bacterium]